MPQKHVSAVRADAQRDAVWKPVLWKRARNAPFLCWLARIPVENLDPAYALSFPVRDGKIWLNGSKAPIPSEGKERTVFRYECESYGGEDLSHLLDLPWEEVERQIREGGEDPLTLPFDDMLVAGLKSVDTLVQHQAFTWCSKLPVEGISSKDMRSALWYAVWCSGDRRAKEVLARPDIGAPVPWIHLCIISEVPETAKCPSEWRQLVRRLLEKGWTREQLFATRFETETQGAYEFRTDASDPKAERLIDWAQRYGIDLVTPELEDKDPSANVLSP